MLHFEYSSTTACSLWTAFHSGFLCFPLVVLIYQHYLLFSICLYLERVILHLKVLHSDFGIKGWKSSKWKPVCPGLGFKCWQLKADSRQSLLGKYRIPVYYWLLSQSAAYYSPTALLSAKPILHLKEKRSSSHWYMSIKKINILSALQEINQGHMFNKWSDLTRTYGTLRPM